MDGFTHITENADNNRKYLNGIIKQSTNSEDNTVFTENNSSEEKIEYFTE